MSVQIDLPSVFPSIHAKGPKSTLNRAPLVQPVVRGMALTVGMALVLMLPMQAQAQSRSVEQRLQRLERMVESQLLNEMLDRLDGLEREIKALRGSQERQQHGLKTLKRRQRELYRDVDQRLQTLERRATAASGEAVVNTAGGAPDLANHSADKAGESAASVSVGGKPIQQQGGHQAEQGREEADNRSGDQQGDYEKAFNLLTEGRYEEAETGFRAFLKRYAEGSYAGNAQYWLGEVYYLRRDFDQALAEFGKVVANYPRSPKRPNALLKMGFTWFEKGDYAKSRGLLQRVVKEYPGTSAARLAANRLKQIKADTH